MARQQHRPSDFHLSPKQVRTLIENTDDFRNRVLIKVLYFVALRRMEASRLDIRDLDLEHNKLTVRAGKGDKDRILPLPSHLVADLKILTKGRSSGPVFLSNRSKAISVRMINEVVKQAGMKAEIKHPDPRRQHLNPHLLRHSFARNTLHEKVPINEVQNILGHENITTTIQVYGRPSFAQVQASMNNVWEKL